MKYVIIGGSAAGVSAAEAIRGVDKRSEIELVTDEKTQVYSRCLLTYLLAGAIKEEKLKFKPEGFYKKNGIDATHGVRAVKLEPKGKKIILDDRREVKFDKLLLATGSRAKGLEIPGVDKKGVFNVRRLEDARGIESHLDAAKTVAVLGGGLIGLRSAYALHARGKRIVVVVKSEHLLSQMLDREAADIIQGRVEANGIRVMTGLEAAEILGNGGVEGVALDNGKTLECQMVIIGKGVEANVELAKDAGIKTHWGILVDGHLKTGAGDVFAAGDVAETFDIARGESWINALWPAASEQGRVAGLNMAGKKIEYDGSLSMNSVDFFGLPSISMGITKPKGEGYEVLSSVSGANYKKVVLKDGRIVGLVLAGDVDNAGVYNILIRKKVAVVDIKDLLLEDTFDYGKVLPLIKKDIKKFGDEFRDTVLTYSERRLFRTMNGE